MYTSVQDTFDQMSLLSKIFGSVPKQKRGGISMGNVPHWEVSGMQWKHLPGFFRALPSLLPEGSVLYLEGTSRSARDLITFLQSHAAIGISKVALGTIWPRPRCAHASITSESMLELACLSERLVVPEVCSHLHAYKDGRILLEWYDAFSDPVLIACDV